MAPSSPTLLTSQLIPTSLETESHDLAQSLFPVEASGNWQEELIAHRSKSDDSGFVSALPGASSSGWQ